MGNSLAMPALPHQVHRENEQVNRENYATTHDVYRSHATVEGEDPFDYRGEFIRLLNFVDSLASKPTQQYNQRYSCE